MASEFVVRNPDFERDARQSFADQGVMNLFAATMKVIEPGRCIIELPYGKNLTQQDGFFHAGVTSTIADSAGGYAALSLMPAGSRILTVEFKVNLLAPADGELLSAEGKVIKHGRTLTVCSINVHCLRDNSSTLCAVVQQTAICIMPKS